MTTVDAKSSPIVVTAFYDSRKYREWSTSGSTTTTAFVDANDNACYQKTLELDAPMVIYTDQDWLPWVNLLCQQYRPTKETCVVERALTNFPVYSQSPSSPTGQLFAASKFVMMAEVAVTSRLKASHVVWVDAAINRVCNPVLPLHSEWNCNQFTLHEISRYVPCEDSSSGSKCACWSTTFMSGPTDVVSRVCDLVFMNIHAAVTNGKTSMININNVLTSLHCKHPDIFRVTFGAASNIFENYCAVRCGLAAVISNLEECIRQHDDTHATAIAMTIIQSMANKTLRETTCTAREVFLALWWWLLLSLRHEHFRDAHVAVLMMQQRLHQSEFAYWVDANHVALASMIRKVPNQLLDYQKPDFTFEYHTSRSSSL